MWVKWPMWIFEFFFSHKETYNGFCLLTLVKHLYHQFDPSQKHFLLRHSLSYLFQLTRQCGWNRHRANKLFRFDKWWEGDKNSYKNISRKNSITLNIEFFTLQKGISKFQIWSFEYWNSITLNIEFFTLQKGTSKFQIWSFEKWNFIFRVLLFKTLNLKFHLLFAFWSLQLITHHIYDY